MKPLPSIPGVYHSLPLLGAQAQGRVFEGVAEEAQDGAVVLHHCVTNARDSIKITAL